MKYLQKSISSEVLFSFFILGLFCPATPVSSHRGTSGLTGDQVECFICLNMWPASQLTQLE